MKKIKGCILYDLAFVLVPIFFFFIIVWIQGGQVQDVCMANSTWNDEICYYEAARTMADYGRPIAWMGYNEMTNTIPPYGPWNPATFCVHALFLKLLNVSCCENIILIINILILVATLAGVLWIIKPSDKEKFGLILMSLANIIPIRFALSGMAECLFVSYTYFFASIYIRILIKNNHNHDKVLAIFLTIITTYITVIRPYYAVFFILIVFLFISCKSREGKNQTLFGKIGIMTMEAIIAAFSVKMSIYLNEKATAIYCIYWSNDKRLEITKSWIELIKHGKVLSIIKKIIEINVASGKSLVRWITLGYLGAFVIIIPITLNILILISLYNSDRDYKMVAFFLCCIIQIIVYEGIILLYDFEALPRHFLFPLIFSSMLSVFYIEKKKVVVFACICLIVIIPSEYMFNRDLFDYPIRNDNQTTYGDFKEINPQKNEDLFANSIALRVLTDCSDLYYLPSGFMNMYIDDAYIEELLGNKNNLNCGYLYISNSDIYYDRCVNYGFEIITNKNGYSLMRNPKFH